MEKERGDGQVGAGAVAGGDVAEHARGEGGHVPVSGTPPSVRSPKVREDKTPRALKPTLGASAEVDSLRYSSGWNAKTSEDRATPASRVVRRPRGLRLSG